MAQNKFPNCMVVILAAGMGTRMKSSKAKVLHEICDRPMILHVVEIAKAVAGGNVVVVIGHQAEAVRAVVSRETAVHYALQEKQLGTGHAVLCAMTQVPEDIQDVVILCGDVPLLSVKTLNALLAGHCQGNRDLSVLATTVEDPTGYGRIVCNDGGDLLKIVEEADATDAQRSIKTVNAGIYCVKRNFLAHALDKISSDNAQGEFYLTDIIEIGYGMGKNLGVAIGEDSDEVMGVNSLQELAVAERHMRRRQGKIS